MSRVVVVGDELARFRRAARWLAHEGLAPEGVDLVDDAPTGGLFGAVMREVPDAPATLSVPRAHVDTIERAACHRDPQRWNVLYRLLWRRVHGEPDVFDVPTDPDVRALSALDAAVRRDLHKMKAFVRFAPHTLDGEETWAAWHGSEHRILRLATPFFVDRFGSMRWWLLTPWDGAVWDRTALTFGPGMTRREAQQTLTRDALDELWKSYYAHIFNPARLHVRAMHREMPRKHWATLPEAALITDLLLQSPARAAAMTPRDRSARSLVPTDRRLPVLRDAARACDVCGRCGVFAWPEASNGEVALAVLLERPEVLPAFEALRTRAGLDASEVYVTFAVKHGGGRARAAEVAACRPWLDAEIEALRPRVVLAMGVTAGRAVLGPLAGERAMGAVFEQAGGAREAVFATWAPDAGRDDDAVEHLRAAWFRATR